jgi:hypothetical protein
VFSSHQRSDWFTLGYQGSNQVFFQYAPNGVSQNWCITESGSALLLSKCTGANSQLFVANPGLNGGYTWTNVATGLNITDNGLNKPLTAALADGLPDQEWNFTTN